MDGIQEDLSRLREITNDLKHIDAKLVQMCDTEQAAMRLCRQMSRVHYTDESLAGHLGISKGHLNQLLNSDQNKRERHTSRVLGNRLQRVCGNRALNQWADMELEGTLNCQRTVDDRRAELLAELATLEGQA